ncbi:MAG: DNA-binding response regulator [Legionellales bacterium]|nr:DNA-binding response regulator [Legionellales bacterium]
MRILIVEDEVKTLNYLKKGLTEHGYVVDMAEDGIEGLYLAENNDYELIILDIMLPKIDGWTVLQKLRQTKQTPVLFLSARDTLDDRVKGLELGADDYLIKPFAFSELLARMRSILRRGHVQQTEVMEIANLKIDLLKHKVYRNDKHIDLTPKEFSLLSLLARREGEVLSRTLIAEQVWDMNFDSDTNIIDVAIRRLRQKVDSGCDDKLIHTIRGVGYVLEKRSE